MAGKVTKIFIVAVLIVAVCGIIVYKHIKSTNSSSNNTQTAIDVSQQQISKAEPRSLKNLPCLVDLGADKCIPCKMMVPVLEELKKEYAGRLKIEVIDVWENPDEVRRYGIKVIPTQIFYDASGQELFRHEGFIPMEDILAKWKELGVELTKTK